MTTLERTEATIDAKIAAQQGRKAPRTTLIRELRTVWDAAYWAAIDARAQSASGLRKPVGNTSAAAREAVRAQLERKGVQP